MDQRRDSRPHGTTVLGVQRDGMVAVGADGQVTMGDVVLKHRARKLRTLADGSGAVTPMRRGPGRLSSGGRIAPAQANQQRQHQSPQKQ